jgi:creatinine amidohydrolase
MSENVLYAELTPQEFRERIAAAPIAYLPLGTLEWHGEHMPLGADGIQPYEFFQLLARQAGGVVFPMLFVGPDRMRSEPDGTELYGMDILGDNYPPEKHYPEGPRDGSCYWLPTELFAQLLDAILKQIARAGFRMVLAVGHGPSTAFFRDHLAEYEERYGLKCFIAWSDDDWPAKGDPRCLQFQTGHGGMNETSLVAAVRPELVRMERLGDDPSRRPVAVSDDPRKTATPEHGREIIDHQLEKLGRILRNALSRLA